MNKPFFQECRCYTYYSLLLTGYYLPVTIYQLPLTMYQLPAFPLDNCLSKKGLQEKTRAKNTGLLADMVGVLVSFQSLMKPAPGAGAFSRSGTNPENNRRESKKSQFYQRLSRSFVQTKRVKTNFFRIKNDQNREKNGENGRDRGQTVAGEHDMTLQWWNIMRSYRKGSILLTDNALWHMEPCQNNSKTVMISRKTNG